MNYSIINECGTCKNIICGHFSFEVVLVSSPNIIIVTLKSKQTSISIKICSFTINRDHSNKIRETRAVIYGVPFVSKL